MMKSHDGMNGLWILVVLATILVGRTDAVNGEDAKPAEDSVRIDCDFPGGNILVDRLEGDEVFLKQDPRDTEGFWFYWSFRVRGAQGRRLTFRFTGGNVVGVRGPAVGRNDGASWHWLDDDTVTPGVVRLRVRR